MPRSRARSSGSADRSRAGSSPAARRPLRPIRRASPGSRSVPTTGSPCFRASFEERPVHGEVGPAQRRPAELPVDLGAPGVAPHRGLERGLAALGDHLERERGTAARGEDRLDDPGLDEVVLWVVVELADVHDLRGPAAIGDLARRRVDVRLGPEGEGRPRLRGGHARAPGEEQAGGEERDPRSACTRTSRAARGRRAETERRERQRGRHPGRPPHRVSSATR